MTNTFAVQDNACDSKAISVQPFGIVEAARSMGNPGCRISDENPSAGNSYLASLGFPSFSQLFGSESTSNPGGDTACGGKPIESAPACNSGDQNINITVGDNGRTVQSNGDGSSASTVVQPNDSLYKIASDLLGGDSASAEPSQIMNLAMQIADKNSITPPYTIYPGEQLNVPDAGNIPQIANALSSDQTSAQTPGACGESASNSQVTPSSLEQQVKTDIANGSDEQGYQDLQSNMSNLSGQDQETLKGLLKSDNLIPSLAAGAVQNSLDQSGNPSFSYDDALAMSSNTPVDKALAHYVQNNFNDMAGGTMFSAPQFEQITPDSLTTFESNHHNDS